MSVCRSSTNQSPVTPPVAGPTQGTVVRLETVPMYFPAIGPGGKSHGACLTVAFDDCSRLILGASVCPANEPFKELVCLADGQGIVRNAAASVPDGIGDALVSYACGQGVGGYLLREPVTVCLDAGSGNEVAGQTLEELGCRVRFPDTRLPARAGGAERVMAAVREALGIVIRANGNCPVDLDQCRTFAVAVVAYASMCTRRRSGHAAPRAPTASPRRARAGSSGKGNIDKNKSQGARRMPKPITTELAAAANRRAAPPSPAEPFFGYPSADRALQALAARLEITGSGPAGSGHAGALVIVGAPRSGKTTLLREFARQHARPTASGNDVPMPVLIVDVPGHAGSKALAVAVATALGARLPASATVAQSFHRVTGELVRRNVRVLVLDEAHHLFQGDGPADGEAAAWALQLSGQGLCSVVLAGLPGALTAPGRFGRGAKDVADIICLDGLRADDPAERSCFLEALKMFRRALPDLDAGDAVDEGTATKLLEHCGGLVGRLSEFMDHAAAVARETGSAGLTRDVLRSAAERTRGTDEGWRNPFDPDVPEPGVSPAVPRPVQGGGAAAADETEGAARG